MTRFPRLRLLAATSLLLAIPQFALASGGDGYGANRFANEYQVATAVLGKYAAGNLGVLSGSYWRIYLFMAYQSAHGRHLNAAQLASLKVQGWHVGALSNWDYQYDPEQNGVAEWLKVRTPLARQAGLAAEVKLEIMGTVNEANYVNCHADAFKQAAATARARAQLGPGGKPDPWFKAWLQGQDAVFANCEEPPFQWGQPQPPRVVQLPPAVPGDAPAWLKADRAYQLAAANFYARNFELARQQFQAIAQDAKSPWQPLGAYLAARCLIRSATLLQDDAAARRVAQLQQARQELEKLAPSYAPARQLISLVDARIDPAARAAELARRLERESFSAETPRLLNDYLVLLDKMPRSATINAREPLTAWIGSMQGNAPEEVFGSSDAPEVQANRKLALESARKQWQKQPEALWLTPILTLANGGELSVEERKAAAAVKAGHPLYLTMQYNLARLAIAEKRAAQADADIDRVLAAQGKGMSIATTNRFLAMKMQSAATLDGFVKAAVRRPDQVELGEEIDGTPASGDTDEDFRLAVYRYLPMATLKALHANGALPAAWKVQLQEAMLARALIANDEATALSLLDAVAKGRKTTGHLYARYRQAASGEQRKLAGALILVNTPELNPQVVSKQGLSRNWGCGNSSAAQGQLAPAPRFLTQEQLDAADKEQQQLWQLPLRSEFMAPTLLAWAASKPDDEEAPKALHYLVASTRMECPYGTAKPEKEQLRARYSKEAFNLLHKLYPKSSWAQKTRYFF